MKRHFPSFSIGLSVFSCLIFFFLNISPVSATLSTTTSVTEGVIAYVDTDGDLYLWKAETNQRIQLTTDANQFHYASPQFSPDGDWLAFLKSDPKKGESLYDLYIMNLSNKNTLRLVENVDSFDWSANNQSIVFTFNLAVSCESPDHDTAHGIWTVDTGTGKFTELIPPLAPNHPLSSPTLSFDDQWISYKAYPCFSDGSNALTKKISSGEEYNFSDSTLNWYPDQNRLVYGQEMYSGGTGYLYSIFPNQTNEKLFYKPDGLAVSDPHWSPDGRWIELRQHTAVTDFFFTDDVANDWIDQLILVNSDGNQTRTICETSGVNSCQFQAWSPSGGQLVFTKNTSTSQVWSQYSLEDGSVTNLMDFGYGGMDWIDSLKEKEVFEPTYTPESLQAEMPVDTQDNYIQESNTQSVARSKSSPILIGGITIVVISLLGLGLLLFLLSRRS